MLSVPCREHYDDDDYDYDDDNDDDVMTTTKQLMNSTYYASQRDEVFALRTGAIPKNASI
jgi:hypothetical protein